MLVDSRQLRYLLSGHSDIGNGGAVSQLERQYIEKRPNHQPSINPIPALIIILLGQIMSSHHQPSMVSTMIHAQWGNMLIGAGIARIGSYILLFLSPPKSTQPGRLPTELLASFGLMAGGLIFMASVGIVRIVSKSLRTNKWTRRETWLKRQNTINLTLCSSSL